MKEEKAKYDVPGATAISAALVQREMLKLANSIYVTQGRIDSQFDGNMMVKSIKIRLPNAPGGDYMAVITADTTEGSKVSFHGGSSLPDVLRGLCERLNNGRLKWRDDEYA